MKENRGTIKYDQTQITGNQCLYELLGPYIDIRWVIKSGQMNISTTKHNKFQYSKNQQEEQFHYVPLKHHGAKCPLVNSQIAKCARPMRPCSVVFIQDDISKNFLATQRPLNISFGGKWVLPGGHLQAGQGIIEGGIRQCTEEVGLNNESIKKINFEETMVWQSVYTVNQQIKATGLVLFFRIKAKTFQVKPQAGEIEKWEWRALDKQPWGGGWAEGHLSYLRHISLSNL